MASRRPHRSSHVVGAGRAPGDRLCGDRRRFRHRPGLAAAAAGLFGYALLGTSKQLLVSPTSSTAAISLRLVGTIAAGDAARIGSLSAALAILVGIVFVILGLAKIGFIARFIPTAVQVGFMFGLGLTILVGQLAEDPRHPGRAWLVRGGGDATRAGTG